MFYFFFFQAEDGIRDLTVTGVQTCALPISGRKTAPRRATRWAPVPESAASPGAPAGCRWDRATRCHAAAAAGAATPAASPLWPAPPAPAAQPPPPAPPPRRPPTAPSTQTPP